MVEQLVALTVGWEGFGDAEFTPDNLREMYQVPLIQRQALAFIQEGSHFLPKPSNDSQELSGGQSS